MSIFTYIYLAIEIKALLLSRKTHLQPPVSMPVSSAKLPDLEEARISSSDENAYKSHKNGRNILISSPQSAYSGGGKKVRLHPSLANQQRVRIDTEAAG